MLGISTTITPCTSYILSTSGRIESCRRYQRLLQEEYKLDIVYLPYHSIDEDKISAESFVWAIRGMPCIGGAISRDIKQSIVPLLDEIDESGLSVNAVNTVIRSGNKLKGYNTDVMGFKIAMEKGISLSLSRGCSIQSAVIYGYGGVTNVAAFVLKNLGIDVYITGRRDELVRSKAEELNVKVWTEGVSVDLFINAAPVTNSPLEQVPNFIKALSGCKVAFDHELNGEYLSAYCVDNNIAHISGMDMYIPQMIVQWKLFLEGRIDISTLEDVIRKLI